MLWEYLAHKVMLISSASKFDRVMINANMRTLYRKKYHCEEEEKTMLARIPKNADDNYVKLRKEQFDIRKKHKGCGHVLNRKVDVIDNIVYNTCLCKLKHPLMYDIMLLEKQYDKGIMPFSGGVLEQPSQIIELLEIAQGARIKEENERSKKDKK